MVKLACDPVSLQVTGGLSGDQKSNAVSVVSFHDGELMHFLHVAVEMTDNSHWFLTVNSCQCELCLSLS